MKLFKLFILALTISGCSEKQSSKCQLEKLSFKIGDIIRDTKISWSDGKISKMNLSPDGITPYGVEMNATYNSKDQIIEVLSTDNSLGVKYNFENDVIKSMTYIGGAQYVYSYKENQIVKGEMKFGESVVLTLKYEYLNDTLKKVNRYSSDHKLEASYLFRYDDKVNPFKEMNPYLNAMVMNLGLPAGSSSNNIIEMKIISYKFDENTGEAIELNNSLDSREFTYNEQGYPLTQINNQGLDTIFFSYNCIE
jgi:hypothetical protein